MSINQLALWNVEAPSETMELPFSWADGDTSLAQLERLAGLLLQHGTTCRDDSGKLHLLKVLSTCIEGGRVIATACVDIEVERTLGMLQDRLLDEDDEC